jgi:hypothetical protein
METAKRIIFLFILAMLVISPVQSDEKQATRISNTRTANCLVKVTCDPAILPLNLETIDYLLHSSGVGGKAHREVLDISPDQYDDLFIIEYVQSLASDDFGGAGLPLRDSRTGRSSKSEGDMDEYEYAMMMEMEMEMGKLYGDMMDPTGSMPSTRSSRGRQRTRRIPSTSRTITATSDFSADEQTFLFSLHIELPEQVKPLAMEFMSDLVENLRQVLTDA